MGKKSKKVQPRDSPEPGIVWRNVTRMQADELLRDTPTGTYLVRPSAHDEDSVALSFMLPSREVSHILIFHTENGWVCENVEHPRRFLWELLNRLPVFLNLMDSERLVGGVGDTVHYKSNIFFSLCGPLQEITQECAGSAICQEWLGGSASLGAATTVQWVSIPGKGTADGVRMVGSKGTADTIKGQSIQRSFTLDFLCPAKVNKAHEQSQSHPTFVNEDQEKLTYSFTWVNSAGCPVSGGSDGMGGGTIFVLIVVIGFLSYCVFGAIFMAAVKGARGQEVIPHLSFWTELPKYIKDGFGFVSSKVRGGGGSYSTV